MGKSLDRYHRQMLLPGFGQAGQARLLESSVLVVGCGALGTVIANMLARAGVGNLVIVDRDFIEITNLQRQVLFDESDVDNALPKAEAAKQKIARINSQVHVTAIVDDLNHTNIESIAHGCDVMIDGVDNFETRFLVNDMAVKHGIPYVYGGAVGTVGMTYAILPHGPPGNESRTPWGEAGRVTPCLRCIFDQAPPPGMNPTCDTVGVLGPVVSVVANHQVAESLKILTGNWEAINEKMVHIDLWANTYHQFGVASAYALGNCTCCKQRIFEHLEGKLSSATTTLCGRDAVQLSNRFISGQKLDLNEIAKRLKPHGVVKTNKFMLRADLCDNGQSYELTLFTDGRAIIKGTKHAGTAKSIYAKYVGN